MSDSTTYHRLVDYLKGLLSSRQRHELEKEIMRDAFEEEAFEGLSQMSAGELEADMANLTGRLEARIRSGRIRSMPFYLRIAAVLVLLVGLGSLLIMILRKPSPAPLAQKVTTENLAVPPAPASADSSTYEKRKTPESPAKKPAKQVLADNRITIIEEDPEMILEMAQEEPKPVALQSQSEPLKMAETERTEDASGKAETGAFRAQAADIQGETDTLNDLVLVGYGNQKKIDETIDAFIKPVPPGGSLKDFKKWVIDRLDNDALKAYAGKQKIMVNLTVHTNGTVSDIQIRDSVPDSISSELKRVIAGSPLWKPAMKDNAPVEALVAIQFMFIVE